MISNIFRSSFEVAASAVADRKEEINRLNVFPVPDGDTGTNMSLTLGSVVTELAALPADSDMPSVCKAITHGSLMGARGNSGVITSQILRGVVEGFVDAEDEVTTPMIASAFRSATKVAFQAVRKPVEGTILTVLKDTSKAADVCEKKKLSVEETLDFIVSEAFASVARTPELLPVLKENGVVDAGGFGLAIFIEAFIAAAQGKGEYVSLAVGQAEGAAIGNVEIELNDDWEGSQYKYCTEFLVYSDKMDEEETLQFLTTMGDCELLVGMSPNYKIHVHTNTPDKVLNYVLKTGEISNVFIHNMDLEAQERTEGIAAAKNAASGPHKDLGFVAIAAGEGQAEVLRSIGIDHVVFGGQTMNPSTADILEAVGQVNADRVIVFPNNKNIIMAAQSAAQATEVPVGVVPTRSVLQSITAMFALNTDSSLEENVEAMTEALETVHDGEITTAIRESHAEDGAEIHAGDLIAIVDGKIDIVGQDLAALTLGMVELMNDREPGDTLTVFAGEDLSDEDFEEICDMLEEKFDDMEVEAHRGEQPLYPIVLSLE